MTHHSWWASPRLQARCSCFSLSHIPVPVGGDMVTGPVKQCASSKALETAECCDSPKVWSNVQSCYSSGALYIVKCRVTLFSHSFITGRDKQRSRDQAHRSQSHCGQPSVTVKAPSLPTSPTREPGVNTHAARGWGRWPPCPARPLSGKGHWL